MLQGRSAKSPKEEKTKEKGWLGFGLEMVDAGLSVDEEKQLEPRVRASLAAGRVVRARQANAARKAAAPAEEKATGWLDFGIGTLPISRTRDSIRDGCIKVHQLPIKHISSVVFLIR